MLQLNGRGGTGSSHNGVPFMYATPLNNATSSWSSPVTRMRQVESVRVRETFVGRGSEPARADGFEPGDVRLAANRQHPMGIAGQREGEVGERKQRATLQDADGIQMARFDRHLRAGEPRADFDDPDSILPREAVLFEKRRHLFVPFRWFHSHASNTIMNARANLDRPGGLSYFRFLDLVCNRMGVPMKPNFFRI